MEKWVKPYLALFQVDPLKSHNAHNVGSGYPEAKSFLSAKSLSGSTFDSASEMKSQESNQMTSLFSLSVCSWQHQASVGEEPKQRDAFPGPH